MKQVVNLNSPLYFVLLNKKKDELTVFSTWLIILTDNIVYPIMPDGNLFLEQVEDSLFISDSYSRVYDYIEKSLIECKIIKKAIFKVTNIKDGAPREYKIKTSTSTSDVCDPYLGSA